MSLDGTQTDPPATPPAEAFDSLAEHAAHYNAAEQAVPVEPVTPVAPTSEAPPDGAAAEAPETPGPSEPEPEPSRDERGQFVKKAKPRDDPRARVEQATRDAAAARRHAAELQARLQALEAQRTASPAPPVPEATDPSDPKPKLEQFLETEDPYAELAAALGRWGARQEHKTIRQRELLNARQAAIETRLGTFQSSIASAREQFPDWDEKVAEIDDVMGQVGFTQWPPVMLEAILYSDKAIDVTRYLATHPEDTVQLARETARLDATAVPVVRRLLEARIPGEAAAARTGPAPTPTYRPAATPIAPVRTSSPATVDRPPGDDAPFSDHKRYWDRQEREERRRH